MAKKNIPSSIPSLLELAFVLEPLRGAGQNSQLLAAAICEHFPAIQPDQAQRLASRFSVRGKGQTIGRLANGTYQIGVCRTLKQPQALLWLRLICSEGLGLWMDGIEHLPQQKGESVLSARGSRVELRSLWPGSRIRVRRYGFGGTTTIQVTLQAKPNGTQIRFHEEGLSSASQRETRKRHWESVIRHLQLRAVVE